MPFHEELERAAGENWQKMTSHVFLKETAAGTIPRGRFLTWLRQDYIFVRDAIPFIAVVSSRAPVDLRKNLASAIPAFYTELELFESMAGELGVALDHLMPSPTCASYLAFLNETAHMRTLEEAMAVLYAAEKAYFESWLYVKQNLKGESPYRKFIDNWANDNFAGWVDWLKNVVNSLAENGSEGVREKMRLIYIRTMQYEYLFWNMAHSGESWPL